MATTTVLIIGCGIAGPLIASLLKRKGYNPIVFEKVRMLGDAGASLMMQPNGMKVLHLVGIADQVKKEAPAIAEFREAISSGRLLACTDVPSTFEEKYSQPAIGIKRTTLNLMLKDMIERDGIEVREGWRLERLQENEEGVVAFFNGGRSATGSFLVGCDGIKSETRRALLEIKGVQEGAPSFCGIVQTAGFSATPKALIDEPRGQNWYGQAAHMLAYPISPTHSSWGVTLPGSTVTEADWRLYSSTEMIDVKQNLKSICEGWDPSCLELVESAERIVKFGLFDRQELDPDQWYSKRCVLVGDAAHPTSPHLGQGANQTLEDCYYLSNALPDIGTNNDERGAVHDLGTHLPRIFCAFAGQRQPRTSTLVKGARAVGEMRVVTGGPQACKERDEAVAASYWDKEAVAAKYDSMYHGPFEVKHS